MKLMERIETGKSAVPRRLLLFGVHGSGKSTYAASAPSPIFIQTEDGLSDIGAPRFPMAKCLSDVMNAISELYSEKHDFKTVIVDTVDWLEKLIWVEICRKKNVSSIEDIGYGKGYVFALDVWREFLEGLSALRDDKGMIVLLIAHSRIERFENPETESYDRYVPRLHRLASQILQEWADEVFFATYRVHVKHNEEGFNRKRTQAIGTGERILRTTERPSHVAKNRLGLADELPLDWNEYAKFFPKA